MTSKELKYHDKIDDKVYFVRKLDFLGLNRRYFGYFLLVEIMNILINEETTRITSFSKQVYPIVAERYNISACTIERNIRNLIDKCWSTELMNKLNVYFPDTQKPTCQDFVFMIKNYMVRQIL